MSDLRLWHRGELNKLRRDMQDLFDCLVRDFCGPFDLWMLRQEPVLGMETEGDTIVITAHIPQLDPATLKLSVQDDRLYIFGENVVVDELEARITRHSFSSMVLLPCSVNMEQAEARFDDGMLRISLPLCTTTVRVKVNGANA